MIVMTDKQLKNLPTPRLNNLRRLVIKAKAAALYNVETYGNECDITRAEMLTEYYDRIKAVMSTREHIESSSKPRKRSRTRETIRRMDAA